MADPPRTQDDWFLRGVLAIPIVWAAFNYSLGVRLSLLSWGEGASYYLLNGLLMGGSVAVPVLALILVLRSRPAVKLWWLVAVGGAALAGYHVISLISFMVSGYLSWAYSGVDLMVALYIMAVGLRGVRLPGR